MSPSVFGVGYFGIGPYKGRVDGKQTRAYMRWKGILERCYDPRYLLKRPSYQGCSVCLEWCNYQAFAQWYEGAYRPVAKLVHLDKDWLLPGNKEYGPEACLFIPAAFNNLLTNRAAARGDLPQGVSRYGKGFRVQMSRDGKQYRLGTFATVTEAQLCYLTAKRNWIELKVEGWLDKLQRIGRAPDSYLCQVRLGLARQLEVLDQAKAEVESTPKSTDRAVALLPTF